MKEDFARTLCFASFAVAALAGNGSVKQWAPGGLLKGVHAGVVAVFDY